MRTRHLVLAVAVALSFVGFVSGRKFLINFDDEINPCPDKENDVIGNYVDYEHMTIEHVDDENIRFDGFLTVMENTPEGSKIELDAVVEKQEKGEYKDSGLSITKSDFCGVLFNNKEIWYDYVQHFEGSQRDCPFKEGTNLTWDDVVTSLVLDSDAPPETEGHYRLTINFKFEQREICAVVEADLELLD